MLMYGLSFFFLIFGEKIRNFGIVAHVDRGKSTLAMQVFLQKHFLQVGREGSVTVKAQSCTMFHKVHRSNHAYIILPKCGNAS